MGKRKYQGNKKQNNNNKSSTKFIKNAGSYDSVFHIPVKKLFEDVFGFKLIDISSWESFINLLYKPTDPASLGILRALFGLMMVLDIPEERGLSEIDIRWGDENECTFPLFNIIKPFPLEWMCIIFLIMWIGAIGIMLGMFFKISCAAFLVPYWYLFLLDKSSWNNHTYLYGLVGILLLVSKANYYWSVDILIGRAPAKQTIPLWNYAILRFQLFILYFYAGLKKLDSDWIEGYSMTNLSTHWIFEPFKFIFTTEQIDYWIVHFSGFILDLTIGFWLFFNRTRPYAMFFCASFHIMNSRLFSIGMFPYVCLVTMPIFCNCDWPKQLMDNKPLKCAKYPIPNSIKNTGTTSQETKIVKKEKITWKHNMVALLLISHAGLQVFLPYSHFITVGYNNWTKGLYGYSWDMMVHSWDTILVVVRVVDNNTGKEHFLDPEAWVQNDRWTKHGDMMVQYANCLKNNLYKEWEKHKHKNSKINDYVTGDNISIYFDVWCSLNGRFQQRMFNPNVDILQVNWSPFEKVSWLMPLLTEFSPWRQKIMELEKEVYTWSNYSDALFIADFPGLTLENYITEDLSNVTLTVLEGDIIVEDDIQDNELSHKQVLSEGASISIPVGVFHKVHTISPTPSCYMYSYVNQSKQLEEQHSSDRNSTNDFSVTKSNFMVEISHRIDNFVRAIGLVSNAILHIVFSVPMIKRVRIG